MRSWQRDADREWWCGRGEGCGDALIDGSWCSAAHARARKSAGIRPATTALRPRIASDTFLLLRPVCDRRILRCALGLQSGFIAARQWRRGTPMARRRPQHPGPWRNIDVILPRHDLRKRDHQWRQRYADNGLRGQAVRSWPLSGRGAYPPSPRLERALHRDNASVRASRLSRDLRQPLRARGWRQRRQP